MISLAFRLLGVGRWLKEVLGALLSVVRRYPGQAALVLCLCFSGWLWRGKEHAERDRDMWKAAYTAQKAGQDAAKAKAAAARAATEKLSKGLTDAADANARYLDAGSRRSLAERVRAKAPSCPSGGTPTAAVSDSAPSAVEADTAGVYLTLPEAEALRQHEVRSTTCNDWAQSLIDSGLAVSE